MSEKMFLDTPEFYLDDLVSRFKKINGSEYYLSYSGGKDSSFLYWFIKDYLHMDDIEVVAVNTRMEHPQIMQRMYKYADTVLVPEMTIQDIKKRYGIPCFGKQKDQLIYRYQSGCRSEALLKMVNGETDSMFKFTKYQRELLLSGKLHKVSNKCCLLTKEKTAGKFRKATGKKAILAVRQNEGLGRRQAYKSCFSSNGTFTPIYDLPDEYLEWYLEYYRIELADIYRGGYNVQAVWGVPMGIETVELKWNLAY